jgi:uncharacterized repeat protein (TIGR03803 family)
VVPLYSFEGADLGSYPQPRLLEASDGLFYGTTSWGGDANLGIVFRIHPDGSGFERLHSFSGVDGAHPGAAELIQASDGWLYGTTFNGGDANVGVVFRLRRDGSGFERLHSFSTTDGALVEAGLLQASDGALYGATINGGPYGGGVVFRLGVAAPAAQVTPTALDFGGLNVGASSGPQSVVVTNTGGPGATVTSVVATGDFSASSGCTVSLGSGEACSIDVVFQPTLVGPAAGTLTVTTNAGGPFVVSLAGVGTAPAVSLTPSSLDFGSVPIGESSIERIVTLTNTGTGPLVVANAAASPAVFAVTRSTCTDQISSGNNCFLGLRFVPSGEGSASGRMTVTTNAGSLDVALQGNGVAPLGPRAFRPVAPQSGNFMWQTLQEDFVDSAGDTCNAPVAIAVGDRVICYSAIGGELRCSGAVYQTTYNFDVPVGITSVDQIMVSPTSQTADGNAICVHKTDGTMWCMGNVWNGSGQFGVGSTETSSAFLLWGGRTDLKRVGTGTWDQMCGLTSSNQVMCSGHSFGTVPILVGSGTSFYVSTFGTVTIEPEIDRASPGRSECTVVEGALVCPGHAISSTSPVVDGGARRQDLGEEYCLLNIEGAVECSLFEYGGDTRVDQYLELSDALALATNPYTRRICAIRRNGSIWCADGGPGSEVQVQPAGSVATACTPLNPPVAQVAPASLTFGNLNLGRSSVPQTVTVTNVGGGTLEIASVVATGEFVAESGCAIGIGSGESCAIQVAFVPTLHGPHAGSLTVTTNGGVPLTIDLGGTGTMPVAALTPATRAFGSMAVGVTSAVKTATLANTGDGPLSIASIATTGDYAFTSGCPIAPAILAPGGTCTFDVTFTPTATGSRPGTLRVTDDAAGSPRTVNLTGTGAVVSVSPTSLGFGSVPLQTTSAGKTVTVFNSTLGPLSISSIAITTLATDYAQTNTCPASLAPGASCVVTVSLTPTAAGSRPGQLRITYGATAINVALSGNGTFNLGVAPGSLTFAKQALGTTSAAKTVTLTNAAGAPIILSSITSVSEFPIQSNTCGASLAGGSTCTFTVAFTPSAAGTRTGQVTIADNATGNPHKVNLTGTGTIPLTVAPASLGFGSVTAGVTGAAKTVTLTNPNPVPITFTSIAASGDYALTSSCGPTLDPSTSCTLSVTFTPTATGSRGSTLDILSDATSSPQKVNLNGTGTLPLNSSGNLGFGSVVAGVTSAPKTITLTNASPLLPVAIGSIALAGGDFAATNDCGGSVPPSGTCTITVTFTPTAPGPRTGTVTVVSNATNSPRTLNLSGTGTLPLSLSPSSLSFGNQAVNTTSAPRTVILTNGSPLLPIPVTGLTLTGDFSQTNDCGTSIPAGGNCTVSVTFRPTASGNRTGQLTVTSGATTTSPARVNLSGRGI